MSQQPAFVYVRHGQSPFFRLPSVLADGYRDHDAIVLGIPWDGASTAQPGSRFAPFHVRRVSAFLQTFHPRHKVDVFGKLRAADGGNVVFPPFAPDLVRHMVEAEISAILDAGATPFSLGGDHSVTLPILRAIQKKYGPVAVVHVDAHLDTSDDSIWGDAYHHGTPMRHALAEGLIARGMLHQIGIRATWGTPEEGAFAASHDAKLFSMDDIDARGVAAIAEQIRSAVGDQPTYVTIDVDGIDPAFAPGTGTPEPGGLTSREAIRLVRELSGIRIVGADVVEVCPALDVGDLTCTLAAHLLYECLALAAMKAAKT